MVMGEKRAKPGLEREKRRRSSAAAMGASREDTV
jgi:hypothetical protein